MSGRDSKMGECSIKSDCRNIGDNFCRWMCCYQQETTTGEVIVQIPTCVETDITIRSYQYDKNQPQCFHQTNTETTSQLEVGSLVGRTVLKR